MGKKGNWITALKKAFTSNPKDKPTNVQLVTQFPQQHGGGRDKKRWGFGRSRQHGGASAPASGLMNIPLYRQPSSIEKILVDAEMEQQRQYYGRAQYQITPAKPTTTFAAPAAPSLPPPPPPVRARARERERDDDKPAMVLPLPPPSSPPPLIRRFDHDREQQQKLHQLQQRQQQQQQQQEMQLHSRGETEWRQPQRQYSRARPARQRAVAPDRARAAAVAIQSAFRGYMARRNYRSLRGLIRLQGVVRGAGVRRQTAHAMRCMQTLVRVQAQVRASRVEAMERRSHHRHAAMLRDGGRWRAGSQEGGMWNDSLLSRDEADARVKRKVDAVIKRERALAYAYSHQLLKATPMAAHAILADLQSGRSPWWWGPIEARHEVPETPRRVVDHVGMPRHAAARREMGAVATAATTPARSVVSSYSKLASRPTRQMVSSHGGGGSVRDDESLTSCPAFGVPNYMTPTVSAAAKARARARVLLQQQQQQAAAAQEKPRFSFGLGQSIGSWAKSPFWKAGGGGGGTQASTRVGTPAASVAGGGGRHRSTRSVSGLSVDSTVSMPAGIGRRPFK